MNTRRRLLISALKRELPKEYVQVEFLKCTGTQYINTGVVPTPQTSAMYKYSISTLKPYGPHILTGQRCFFPILRGLKDMYAVRGNGVSIAPTFDTQANTIYEVEAYRNDNKIIINGVEYGSLVAGDMSDASILYLCAYGVAPTNTDYTLIGNIYCCKMWENDKLIRDFVPCYRVVDGLSGFYDLVGNSFYPSIGSSDFIAGGDV